MSDDFKGRGGSPWGSPPGGGNNNGSGRGPKPPNIDEIIQEIQDKIKKFLPGGKSSGGKSIGLILLVLDLRETVVSQQVVELQMFHKKVLC